MDRFARKFTFTRGLKRKKPEHPQLDDESREYPSSSLIAILKRKLKTCEAYSRRLEKRLNHISKIHREDRAALEYERKMRHAAEEQLVMSGVAMIQQAEEKWTALCTEQSTLQNKLSIAESQLQLVPARLEEILREVARVTGSPEQGVFEHFRHFVDCSLALEIMETRSDDMDVEVSVVQLPTQVVLQPTQVVFHQPQYQPPPPPQLQPQFELRTQPNPQFQPQPNCQPHPQLQPQPQLQSQPQFEPQFQPQPQFQPRPQLQPQPEEQYLYYPQPQLESQPQPQAVCLQPNPNAHSDSHPNNSSPPLPTPAPSPHSTRPTFTRPHPQTEDYFSPRPLWSVPEAGDDADFDCARTEDNTSDEEDGEDDSDEEDSDDEDSDDEDEDRPIPSNTRRVDLSIRMPKQTQPMPPGVGDTSGLPTP